MQPFLDFCIKLLIEAQEPRMWLSKKKKKTMLVQTHLILPFARIFPAEDGECRCLFSRRSTTAADRHVHTYDGSLVNMYVLYMYKYIPQNACKLPRQKRSQMLTIHTYINTYIGIHKLQREAPPTVHMFSNFICYLRRYVQYIGYRLLGILSLGM